MRLSMKWQSDRPARRALCAAAAVVVLYGAAGIALDAAWVPRWTSIDAQAVALPQRVDLKELTINAARRCPRCGWIESKREILPGAAHPRVPMVYEYTARMADGSSSVFREELPVSWRLGERLMFIAGAGALD